MTFTRTFLSGFTSLVPRLRSIERDAISRAVVWGGKSVRRLFSIAFNSIFYHKIAVADHGRSCFDLNCLIRQ